MNLEIAFPSPLVDKIDIINSYLKYYMDAWLLTKIHTALAVSTTKFVFYLLFFIVKTNTNIYSSKFKKKK
jgi:hypothetical protein